MIIDNSTGTRRPHPGRPLDRRNHRDGRHARRAVGTAILALVAGVGLAGGASVPAQAQHPATGPDVARSATAQPNPAAAEAAAQVAAVPTPKPAWKPCAENRKLDCARVDVPVDYDAPRGATVSLALVRRRADDAKRRIGSLFFNPGGPGGSGVAEVLGGAVEATYSPGVRSRFDIVGFDPRGIATSTPVQCFASSQARKANRPPFAFPDTAAQVRQQVAADRAMSRACVARAGAIIDHMSTANVARDLDVLRRAVGDRQLTYVGYSYGTYLGQTYANLFPGNVRALLLDSVVDPTAWATGGDSVNGIRPMFTRIGSPEGTSETFAQFLDLCDKGGKRCAFSAGDPAKRYAALATRLRRSGPITLTTSAGTKVQVAYQTLVSTVITAMYAPEYWPALAQFLDALDTGNLTRAAAALAALSPPESPATKYDQTLEGALGVICSDGDHSFSPRTWAAAARESERRTPNIGRFWAWIDSGCASWPGEDTDRYAGPFGAATANPVLFVNNRYDPATPDAGAVRAAATQPGSRLLTVNGWGHIAAGKSACADRHTATYLLTGAMPPAATICAADEVPFLTGAPPSSRRG
jgi:pimeloyl-ACP methyl ester carboxylesterase